MLALAAASDALVLDVLDLVEAVVEDELVVDDVDDVDDDTEVTINLTYKVLYRQPLVKLEPH